MDYKNHLTFYVFSGNRSAEMPKVISHLFTNYPFPTYVLFVQKLHCNICRHMLITLLVEHSGKHYWYNLSDDMDCGDIFPVFLLYNRGKLNGMGWAMTTPIDSPRYEHPPPSSYEVCFVFNFLPFGL